jgi:hypothetical protein
MLGYTTLTIVADPNAEEFYTRMGARRVGVVATVTEGKARELPVLVYDLDNAGG